MRTFFLSPELSPHLSLTSPTLLSCSFCLMLASVLVASLAFVNSDCISPDVSADGDSSLDLSDILPGGGFHISEDGLLEQISLDDTNERIFNSFLREMDRDFDNYDTDDSENVGDVFFPDFDGELWTVDEEEEEVRHLRGQTVSSPVQTISHFQQTVRSIQEKQSCTICLEDLIDNNKSDFVATCGSSSYHPACLQRWIDGHSSCPSCRHHL